MNVSHGHHVVILYYAMFSRIHGCNLNVGDTMIDACLVRKRLCRCLCKVSDIFLRLLTNAGFAEGILVKKIPV